jgi:PPOX class probable F420-dependent enzyme
MSTAMTVPEREDFLAEVRVAVVSVAQDNGRAPLAVPLWYGYQPGGEITLITARNSRKAELIRAAGRISLCVQATERPYRYVTVEGPVTAIQESVTAEERQAFAERYLGPEGAVEYVRSSVGRTEDMMLFWIRPDHWLTVDQGKS